MATFQQSKTELVGTNLQDAPVPSAVLDVAKIKKNCELMLKTVEALDISFRAHIKTHKTIELTRIQVGQGSSDVKLIVSTLPELEHIVPLLAEYIAEGRKVDVLYGIPLGKSHTGRLVDVFKRIGTLTLMIDNPAQLVTVEEIQRLAGVGPVDVFLKTDSGYHRAGLAPTSERMQELVEATLAREEKGELHLLGFYSHNSLSYAGNSPLEAMDNLTVEVEACLEAASTNISVSYLKSRSKPLYISCGAGPTAMSLCNLCSQSSDATLAEAAQRLQSALGEARKKGIVFEIHSGIFATLDLQQKAASSRDFGVHPEDDIAITVLTEVCSIYPDRTEQPEALVSAGCLALGREPCKDYRGHGIISGYNMVSTYDPYNSDSRIILDRIAQEHGLLQWEDKKKTEALPVEYGQRLRVWPNHACITSAQYSEYLVVDSQSEDPDLIREIWAKCRGW